MSEKTWSDDAWEEYLFWQMQDKKTLKRINTLLKDIDRNGPIYVLTHRNILWLITDNIAIKG